MVELEVQKMPQILSPCSSSSRRSNDSNSPEFEFSSFPQPELHSADELFSGGVLLPLHHIRHHSIDQNNPSPPPPTPQEQEVQPPQESSVNGSTRPMPESGSGPVPELSALLSNLSASAFTSSKRWKDIFKKNDSKCSSHANNDVHDNINNNNNNNNNSKEKVKVRKKEKRSVAFGGGGGNGVAAELNINIWPFRRSRSAGNGGARPRVGSTALTSRKVSSAPCSRSNSAGESKSTKWPKSPSRNGVHLGRSSPIWQLRRPTTTSAAGGGGCRHFDGVGKRIEKGNGKSPAGVSGAVAAGDGGGRSFDGVGKKGENGSRKDGNLSGGGKPPAAVSGGSTAGAAGVGQKVKVLKLNVPMCIGYRSNLSCKSDENSAGSVASAAEGGVIGGGRGGCESEGGGSMERVLGSTLFNIRNLFTKKVY